jgi:serine/threonine protein kinase
MANADQLPAPNDVVAEKYRIERVLGQGGMGVVLAAMHLHLEERVAIKFLLPELTHDPAVVARFLREGRTAIKIRSEHVVRVLDVGTLPGGTPYLVMEYLEGINFEQLLEQHGSLPADMAVDHVLQATEALAEAHALGMVHRDLKPANLFLVHRADGSPSVKVLDFGITKVPDAGRGTDLETTNATDVMGSPRYMSPEQMRSSRAIDARADIWGLGVILQELITGSAPFDGATMPDLLASIIQDPPIPLARLQPNVPPGLQAVVSKCLEKEASARYADVAELTQALAPFGSDSARVSADRVSRVLHPTSPPRANSVIPPPRSVRPSGPPYPQESSSSGTVTASATASAWGATSGASRSAARTVALAVGSLFFASVLILAIFGGQSSRGPRARAAGSMASAMPAASPLAAPVDAPAAPVDAPSPVVDPAQPPATFLVQEAAASFVGPVASTRRTAIASPKRRAAVAIPATSASPPVKNESDLFDGRK